MEVFLHDEEKDEKTSFFFESFEFESDRFRMRLDGEIIEGVFLYRDGEIHLHFLGDTFCLRELENIESEGHLKTAHKSPMPGKVIAIHVAVGDSVTRGQPLLVIEAMKMENTISAALDGIVQNLYATAGDVIAADQVLIELEASTEMQGIEGNL